MPTDADLERWTADDRRARPLRLGALRERMARESVDAYFGVRRENTRYLTGFDLHDGEEKVAGVSGQFFVSADEVVVLADSRYTLQAEEQSPDARIENVYGDFSLRWPEIVRSLRAAAAARSGGVRRVAVEAGFVSHATWDRLAQAAEGIELVPVEGWVEELRQTKEPSELERVGSACKVADDALTRLLPQIRAGRDRARAGAWRSSGRCARSGAEALAFDVAVLAGPECRAAARLARVAEGREGRGPALRLRCAGLRLPQRHDADAVRRRADARATPRSTGSSPRRSRPHSRRWRMRVAVGDVADQPRDRRRRRGT